MEHFAVCFRMPLNKTGTDARDSGSLRIMTDRRKPTACVLRYYLSPGLLYAPRKLPAKRMAACAATSRFIAYQALQFYHTFSKKSTTFSLSDCRKTEIFWRVIYTHCTIRRPKALFKAETSRENGRSRCFCAHFLCRI